MPYFCAQIISPNYLDILLISGIIHCVIIAALLLWTGQKGWESRLLSLAIFLFGLHQTWNILYDLNFNQVYPFLFKIPFSYNLAIGPLLFFYVQGITNIRFTWHLKDWIHFLPVLIAFVVQLVIHNFTPINSQDYKSPIYVFFVAGELLLTILSIAFYLQKAIRLVAQHDQWVLGNYSYTKGVRLEWLQKIIVRYRLLWFLMFPYAILYLLAFGDQLWYSIDNDWFFKVLTLLLIVLTYGTSITGILAYRKMAEMELIPAVAQPVEKSKTEETELVSAQELAKLEATLRQAMQEDLLFLQEKLTLQKLSEHTKLRRNVISYVLNQGIGQNFYQFVNEYRVNEVKRKLTDASYANYTLMGIALESGFGSKASFNRAFKTHTGLSPRAYVQNLENNHQIKYQ